MASTDDIMSRGMMRVIAYALAVSVILIPILDPGRGVFFGLFFGILLFAIPIFSMFFLFMSKGPTGQKDRWGDPIIDVRQNKEKLEWATTTFVHYIGVPAIIITTIIVLNVGGNSVRGTYFGGGRRR